MKFSNLLTKLVMTFDRKYNENITELVLLIRRSKTAVTDEEITACINGIIEINKKIENKKKYRQSRIILGKLLEYLNDTIVHKENRYHKPAWNNWNIITRYPDINDYIKIDNYGRI